MAKLIDMSEVWPTPALFRAARGLLCWGQEDLAEKSGFARKTIILIESHTAATMDARRVAIVEELAAFLEKQGVEFVPKRGKEGAGVRFKDGGHEAKVVEKMKADIERRKAGRKLKAEEKRSAERARNTEPKPKERQASKR
ncbi:DNA-binding XRE family transcriptional regulator [Bradyrhizobium sp. USDA 4472]